MSLPNTKVFFLAVVCMTMVSSITIDGHFLTINTSSTSDVVSTSMSTNLQVAFSLNSPILIDNQNPRTKFIPIINNKLQIDPAFIEDHQLLYNEFSEGQHWYGFKKQIQSEKWNTRATFALNTVIVEEKSYNLLLPLFNLPLSALDIQRFYRCQNVLIAHRKTDDLLDLVVFSEEQSWHLFPEATWGFRKKDQKINFSRQTFPLGLDVEIDVGDKIYCKIPSDLPSNDFSVIQQQIFTLSDLLQNYSTALQVESKVDNQQL